MSFDTNAIIQIIIAAVVGATVTYFSSPLTERRLAYIRTQEKITEKRLSVFAEMWDVLLELNHTRSIHDKDTIDYYQTIFPFVTQIYNKYAMLGFQKIFLSYTDFANYANTYASVFSKASILLSDDALVTFNSINVYLQCLIHYFVEVKTLLGCKLTEKSNLTKFEEVFDTFVLDIGVICFDDLRNMLIKAEEQLVSYYEDPKLFNKKRKLSVSDLSDVPFMQNSLLFANKDTITDAWLMGFVGRCESIGNLHLPTDIEK